MPSFKTNGYLVANAGSVTVSMYGNTYELANINSINVNIEYTKVSYNQLGKSITQHAAVQGNISGTMNIHVDTSMWDACVDGFKNHGLMPAIKILMSNVKTKGLPELPGAEPETITRSVSLDGVVFDTMLISTLNANAGDGFVTTDMGFTANDITYTSGLDSFPLNS